MKPVERGGDVLFEESLSRVRSSDPAYRAWAALALIGASTGSQRATGQQLMLDVRAELPPLEGDLEHGDLVAYATLAGECLTRDEQARIAHALPVPHADRAARSRFYDSSVFVYLTTRGLLGDLSDPRRLATFVAESAAAAAEHARTDIADLVLSLAAALELRDTATVPNSLLRATHAQLVSQPGDAQGAIALGWLLERYRSVWPTGSDAHALRLAAEKYVEAAYPVLIAANTLRPEVAAMFIETFTTRSPTYRFVPRDEVQREVSRGIGRQRLVATLAYAFVLAVVIALPMGWLVVRDGLPSVAAVLGAVGLYLPAVVWATFAAYGRRRYGSALAGAVAVALAYDLFAAYAAHSNNANLIQLATTDGLFALIPVVISTVVGALPAWSE